MQRIRNVRTQYCVKRAISFITGTQATILTKKKAGAVHFFTQYLTNLTQPIFETQGKPYFAIHVPVFILYTRLQDCRPLCVFLLRLFCLSDDDECVSGFAQCHENADCLNTVGSYGCTCTCKDGYDGDGFIYASKEVIDNEAAAWPGG